MMGTSPKDALNRVEIEFKFVVFPEYRKPIYDFLIKSDKLDNITLGDASIHEINDCYYDTEDHSLQKAGLAFRERKDNQDHLIAIKGKAKPLGQALRRLEIEQRATSDNLCALIRHLKNFGIELSGAGKRDGFEAQLASFGLIPIQIRKTKRTVRPIHIDTKLVGELALDRVSLTLQNQSLAYDEIEVEAKGSFADDHLERFCEHLMERFNNQLRPWRHSKLVTVMGLKKLFEHPGVIAHATTENRVNAEGFRRLDFLLDKTPYVL
jgi:inorganic triphosphatase YgiF